jgi:putative Mg2+ transporter-C (MgtC) family protein
VIKFGHPVYVQNVSKTRMNWPQIAALLRQEMASGLVSSSLIRLVLAGVLGGIIALERELRHRPAGPRTNMFLCFGSALFTILSHALAVEHIGDHSRIPAQIIPGIGFIGAGSILHARGLATGLTTAATLFVVASVGMAAGGGLYLTAIFPTGMVLLALFALGHLELTFSWKNLLSPFEVTGKSVDEITQEVNRILEHNNRMMQNVTSGSTGQHVRLQLDVSGGSREQKALLRDLTASSVLSSAIYLGPVKLD